MQYRICEKNPNSKIYNKLLFVGGDKKSEVSHTNFPIFFPQIRSGVVMERTSSLTAKKFGKEYF
jgi:hypothetical protein